MYDCLINGEIDSSIPVADRGLCYGHGVFETLAMERGRPVFWQGHLQRLGEGCDQLGLPRQNGEVLLRELQTVCAGHPEAVGKIILTAGSGGRGYQSPAQLKPNRIVSAHPWPGQLDLCRAQGIRLRLCRQRLGHNRPLAKIKHLNRLEQVLARAEWEDESIQDGLLLDGEDFVISATSANLFVVSEGRLLTPRLDRCGVRGVLRDAILGHHPSLAEKRRITLDMLKDADEVFICNSIRGIWPVTRFQDQRYVIGDISRELQGWLERCSPLYRRPL